MAKNYIEKFVHKTGTHCGSTTMSNLLNYYGISLSEELCFGLGSGIGFGYYIFPELTPPVYIMGRTNDLEIFLCNNLNINVSLESHLDFNFVHNILKNKIEKEEPTIIWVDTYYLPYFKSPYHFSVHRVIMVGYEEEYVYIADNERENIQKVSLDDFKKARTSGSFPIPTENRYYEIKIDNKIKSLDLSVRDSINKTCEIMLYSEDENNGVKGINKMAEDLPLWKEKLGENWKEAAKTVYLVSEKFGTGGGNFRHIYVKFLREIAEKIKNKKINKEAKEMEKIANLWEKVMSYLKEASKENDFERIIEVSKILKKVAYLEEKIYNNLRNI